MNEIKNGILTKNPTFVLMLGMCPTLATTTSVENAFGMGISMALVLICSNVVISLLKKVIPQKIRIASYIVIIAGFVTLIEMLMKAYIPALYESLGIFIPLIVVNCIILARAEEFASKNTVFKSFLDGVGTGLGFTLALVLIAFFREILGAGSILGHEILSNPATIFIMAPGGFLVLGTLMASINFIRKKRAKKGV